VYVRIETTRHTANEWSNSVESFTLARCRQRRTDGGGRGRCEAWFGLTQTHGNSCGHGFLASLQSLPGRCGGDSIELSHEHATIGAGERRHE
jgi:hypothetical protein